MSTCFGGCSTTRPSPACSSRTKGDADRRANGADADRPAKGEAEGRRKAGDRKLRRVELMEAHTSCRLLLSARLFLEGLLQRVLQAGGR